MGGFVEDRDGVVPERCRVILRSHLVNVSTLVGGIYHLSNESLGNVHERVGFEYLCSSFVLGDSLNVEDEWEEVSWLL